MEGYGPGYVSMLSVTHDEAVHESRRKALDCGDVSISGELGLTGRPSKHAELSTRITIVE